MGLLDQIGGILKQYETQGATTNDVSAHFDQIASALSQPTLANGIANALRSGQTAGFAQTVSQLFSQANPGQKAGILNQLLGSAAPQAQAILSGTPVNPTTTATPEQAQQVSPDVIKQLAEHVHGVDPSVVDRISGFYAQHPTLVKGVGAAALAVIMSHVSQQHQMGH